MEIDGRNKHVKQAFELISFIAFLVSVLLLVSVLHGNRLSKEVEKHSEAVKVYRNMLEKSIQE